MRTSPLRLALCASLFAFALPLAAQVGQDGARTTGQRVGGGDAESVGERRAVVFGVAEYQHLSRLRYTDDDARAVAAWLETSWPGESEVRVLLDDQVSYAAIDQELKWLLEEATRDSVGQVVIYFAGHGSNESEYDWDESGWLLPPDGQSPYNSTGYPMERLQRAAAVIASKGPEVVVILDACRSGELAGDAGAARMRAWLAESEWGQIIKIVASGSEEDSWEHWSWGYPSDPHEGHGAFTYFLLAGLSGAADGAQTGRTDGRVTLNELQSFLSRSVATEVSELFDTLQTPLVEAANRSWAIDVDSATADSVRAVLAARDSVRAELAARGMLRASNPPSDGVLYASAAGARRAAEGAAAPLTTDTVEAELLARFNAALAAGVLRTQAEPGAWQLYDRLAALPASPPVLRSAQSSLARVVDQRAQSLITQYLRNEFPGGAEPSPADVNAAAADVERTIGFLGEMRPLFEDAYRAKQLFLLGYAQLLKRSYPEAVQQLKQARDLQPEASYPRVALGWAYIGLSTPEALEQAKQEFDVAVQRASRWSFARRAIEGIALLGELQRRGADAEKLSSGAADLGSIYQNAAGQYLLLSRLDRRLLELEATTSAETAAPTDWIRLGVAYDSLARAERDVRGRTDAFARAAAAFEKAIALDSAAAAEAEIEPAVAARLAEAYAGLGDALRNQGLLDRAKDAYARALELDSESEAARAGRAELARSSRYGALFSRTALAQHALVRLDEPVTGILDREDARYLDNTRFEAWRYDGRAGERITVSLTSDAFDPLVMVAREVDGAPAILALNDDGGMGFDAELTIELPADTQYVILASGATASEYGEYALVVEPGRGRPSLSLERILAAEGPEPRGALALGDVRADSLGGSDWVLEDGTPFDVWTLSGAAGDEVTITLRSDAFDPYLMLAQAGASSTLARDDDGAGELDAQLTAVLPEDGEYLILANAIGEAAAGAYELSVERAAPSFALDALLAPESIAALPVIGSGETVSGELRRDSQVLEHDRTRFEAWALEARAGERLSVTMRSAEFDTYLLVGREGERPFRLENDDIRGAEESSDSRVTFEVPADGRYAILANALTTSDAGAYTLTVEPATGPIMVSLEQVVAAPGADVRTLALGEEQTGQLTDGARVFLDQTAFELWRFSGAAGEELTLSMSAAEFDPYFVVVPPSGDLDQAFEDDDGGREPLDSELTFELPASGEYLVIANAVEAGTGGPYTLRLERARPTVERDTLLTPESVAAHTPIRIGETVESVLEWEDPLLSDRTRYRAWSVEAREGELITVTMRSADFDAYLSLGRIQDGAVVPDFVMTNDDGFGEDGGTDARITFRAPYTAAYAIIANALRVDGAGAFTLSVEQGSGPYRVTLDWLKTAPAAAEARPIDIGQTVTGTLSSEAPRLFDETTFELWRFRGRAGELVTVSLASEAVDPYLLVGRVGDLGDFEEDDDSGVGLGSELTLELDADGEYVIVANTAGPEEFGEYTLTLRRAAAVTPAQEVFADPARLPRLALGQTVRGELALDGPVMEERRRFQAWSFEAQAGQRVTFRVVSDVPDELDPVLTVVGPGGTGRFEAEVDDDPFDAESTDPVATLELPAPGLYTVLVSGYGSEDAGAYRLSAEPAAGPLTLSDAALLAPGTPAEPARVGGSYSGRLEGARAVRVDGTPFQIWRFSARAGEAIRIVAQSEEVDTYVEVGAVGGEILAENDDRAEDDVDSELTFDVPADGEYVIIVTPAVEPFEGAYTLTLDAAEPADALDGLFTPQAAASARPIGLGETAAGTLASDAPVLEGRIRYQTWAYRGRAGERVTIRMASEDFDTHLTLGRAAAGAPFRIANDDDPITGGDDTDSRLTVELPEDGLYTIVASAYSDADQGAYTLTVEPADGPIMVPVQTLLGGGAMAAESAAPGQNPSVLDDDGRVLDTTGAFFDVWRYDGRAGEVLRLRVESGAFDAYLYVGQAGGAEWIAENDDARDGDTSSELELELPADGAYFFVVSTYEPRSVGAYRLIVDPAL